jgi:hypothetical protein
MPKFKKGDRVRCINNDDYVSVGAIGTVDENDSSLPWVLFDSNTGTVRKSCTESHMELLEEPQQAMPAIKVGDKIRITDGSDSFHCFEVGQVCTVTDAQNSAAGNIRAEKVDGTLAQYLKPHHYELVTDTDKETPELPFKVGDRVVIHHRGLGNTTGTAPGWDKPNGNVGALGTIVRVDNSCSRPYRVDGTIDNAPNEYYGLFSGDELRHYDATPSPEPGRRCHDCSCHLNPPCSGCVNCETCAARNEEQLIKETKPMTENNILNDPLKALREQPDADTIILRKADLENEDGTPTQNGRNAVVQDLYMQKRAGYAEKLRQAIQADNAAEAGQSETVAK